MSSTHTPHGGIPGISRWRVRLVYALFAAILGGHLVCIAARKDVWPFSRYAMYSDVNLRQHYSELRLYGVTEGAGDEVVLVRPYQPLSPVVTRASLDVAQARGADALRKVLGDTLVSYETRRARRRHDGAPIHAVRLYRVSWPIDPWARNAKTLGDRELLMEVSGHDSAEPHAGTAKERH